MKSVSYRDGLVSFEIPPHWCEDHDPSGSARYYEDGEDTGTMRLNSLPLDRTNAQTPEEAARHIFRGQPYETLTAGRPMRYALTTEEEGGELLHVHRWDVARGQDGRLNHEVSDRRGIPHALGASAAASRPWRLVRMLIRRNT